jgi:hypothetical protein
MRTELVLIDQGLNKNLLIANLNSLEVILIILIILLFFIFTQHLGLWLIFVVLFLSFIQYTKLSFFTT